MFMQMAEIAAKQSHAVRLKVGFNIKIKGSI